MTGHDNGRRYTVTQRGKDLKVITSTEHKDPLDALGNFLNLLSVAGHSPAKVQHYLVTWAVLLMSGSGSYEVLDQDLNGAVSIRMTTK